MSENEVDRQVIESEEAERRSRVIGEIATRLREVAMLAELERAKGQETYHRQMALVQTKAQDALLWALFGGRV